MVIVRPAMSGTMESSDVQISIRPNSNSKNEIVINSPVKIQFGEAMEQVVEKVLKEMSIQGALVTVNDRGALDATLVARLQTALVRSSDAPNMSWEDASAWKN